MGGRLATTIRLPGVHHDNRRVWLGDDGSALQVRAARSLSAQGGRRCLPRSAKLSADGGAEILDLEIPLPVTAVDATRAVVRNVQGGVEVLVPLLPKSEQASRRSSATRVNPTATPGTVPPVQVDSVTTQRRFKATEQTPVIRPKPTWTLPSSEGVEVVEEDWPAEDKLPDAASGWLDNRGDFHEY